MNTLVWSFLPFLFFIIWLGVVIYVLTLIRRLTRAVERIAASMERNLPGDDRSRTPQPLKAGNSGRKPMRTATSLHEFCDTATSSTSVAGRNPPDWWDQSDA